MSAQSGTALGDDRPLSCTQTWATVSYLLERAGLAIRERRFLERVNGFAREMSFGW